jgi:NAD(P)-dependent dehydrogenase (short-subunit alcohol dehydrogenase family)
MGRFDGRVALVTGAASGIGQATAARFAAEGACVLALDVDVAGLEAAAAGLGVGGRVLPHAADVSDRAACAAAVDAAVGAFGRLDTVVNCAGINRFHVFEEMPAEDWHRILAVNLTGVAFVCQAALPRLLETRGVIVNVASVAGVKGQAYTVAYCASKGGVVQLTRALAMEYVDRGVRINAIAPGGVHTPMNQTLRFPPAMDWELVKPYIGRRGLCQPQEIAGAIAWLASDEAAFVHGAVLAVDGGVTAG